MTTMTLVLDNGYRPLGQIEWQKAITLFFLEKVEIVAEYEDKWIHSASLALKMPSVIRFIKGIFKTKVRKTKFSRQNVYVRDKGKCQYCSVAVSSSEFTLDHVLPRSQNGKTMWENVVVCCVPCNRKKADKTPEQANMFLKVQPIRPKNIFHAFGWLKNMPDSWRDYLYWYGELEQD